MLPDTLSSKNYAVPPQCILYERMHSKCWYLPDIPNNGVQHCYISAFRLSKLHCKDPSNAIGKMIFHLKFVSCMRCNSELNPIHDVLTALWFRPWKAAQLCTGLTQSNEVIFETGKMGSNWLNSSNLFNVKSTKRIYLLSLTVSVGKVSVLLLASQSMPNWFITSGLFSLRSSIFFDLIFHWTESKKIEFFSNFYEKRNSHRLTSRHSIEQKTWVGSVPLRTIWKYDAVVPQPTQSIFFVLFNMKKTIQASLQNTLQAAISDITNDPLFSPSNGRMHWQQTSEYLKVEIEFFSDQTFSEKFQIRKNFCCKIEKYWPFLTPLCCPIFMKQPSEHATYWIPSINRPISMSVNSLQIEHFASFIDFICQSKWISMRISHSSEQNLTICSQLTSFNSWLFAVTSIEQYAHSTCSFRYWRTHFKLQKTKLPSNDRSIMTFFAAGANVGIEDLHSVHDRSICSEWYFFKHKLLQKWFSNHNKWSVFSAMNCLHWTQ